jgi:UDP:flavonoid glycosyltransferase YjiC (YdhE family)
LRRPDRPRICLTLGTIVPLLFDGSKLSSLMQALSELDAEVVIADRSTDFSALGALPSNVRLAGYLPLSAFLGTCSLAVHHGGSGTTAAALHYGIPQLVLPEHSDNPLIAQRMVKRKVGLSLPFADITPEGVRDLAQRILSYPGYAEAAREVSAEMQTQPSPASVIHRLMRALALR